MTEPSSRTSRRDALAVAAVALAARAAVVAWAGSRFPPAADGAYYQRVAERIASGHGYTWVWPDGVVTFAAHYPVGYPALLGAAYAVLGASPVVAGAMNALLGTLGALAAHRLVARAGDRAAALVAGLLVALHPGLVLYTPAVMTEGATAALVAAAAWLAARARESEGNSARIRVASLGALVGVATLVRPQSIVLAPLLALLVPAPRSPLRVRASASALALAAALAVCAPWTARNCVRMHRCAMVSVNGGWNLLIGAADGATGAWSPVDVPPACREVWDEAAKDACFGREAERAIAREPVRWLALVPAKLAATFDYCGAAGWYLHASNPAAFDEDAKLRTGAAETLFERLVLLAALAASALLAGPRRLARAIVATAGAVLLFQVHAWLAVVALVAALGLRGRALLADPVVVPATGLALAATAATHAAFFGAGRYGLVPMPLVACLAALSLAARGGSLTGGAAAGDTPRVAEDP